jgi:hypothetical protein
MGAQSSVHDSYRWPIHDGFDRREDDLSRLVGYFCLILGRDFSCDFLHGFLYPPSIRARRDRAEIAPMISYTRSAAQTGNYAPSSLFGEARSLDFYAAIEAADPDAIL